MTRAGKLTESGSIEGPCILGKLTWNLVTQFPNPDHEISELFVVGQLFGILQLICLLHVHGKKQELLS